MKENRIRRQMAGILWAGVLGFSLAGCGASGINAVPANAAGTSEKSDTGEVSVTSEDTSTVRAGDIADEVEDSPLITNDDGSVSQDVYAMDTYMSVKAWGDHAADAVKAGTAEIHRIDDLLSTGKADSEIGRINADGGGDLSEDGTYLVNRSLELYKSTEGVFDIAIYPVMQLWGFPTQEYRVPSDTEIQDTLKLTNASDIQFDENSDGKSSRISFARKGMEIDLGGIAKGYTSSRIMDIFRSEGVTSGLVSLGGNVQTCGKKTDGSLWRVAVEDPDDTSNYLGVLETSDKAVITSGGYERYFEKNGKTYHHIIDPKTGYPADSGIKSSTIVSSDGTLADGLSTSLFIMGLDRAEEYWKKHSDEFDFILETNDGKLHVTSGIADDFTTDREVEVVK